MPPQVAQTVAPERHEQRPTQNQRLTQLLLGRLLRLPTLMKPNIFAICAVLLGCGQSSVPSVLCHLRWSYLSVPAVPCHLNLKPNVCAICAVPLVGADCLCYLCCVICVWANCLCHLCCVCTKCLCRLCRVCGQSSEPTVCGAIARFRASSRNTCKHQLLLLRLLRLTQC